ncbi:MAG: hypothetical protein AAGK37_18105 [Pseudomonadota bacterium]
MSDPNIPPFLYGIVIVAVLVTYAFAGLMAVVIMAGLADMAMRRFAFIRAKDAVPIRTDPRA